MTMSPRSTHTGSRNEVPGSRLHPLLQTLQFWTQPIEMLEQLQREHGDAFQVRFIGLDAPAVFVSGPQDIKKVFTGDQAAMRAGEGNVVLRPIVGKNSLLTLDGEAHLRHRRLLMPPLRGERMPAYTALVRQRTEHALARMPEKTPFSVRPFLRDVTLEAILTAVFGLHEGDEMHRMARLLSDYVDVGNSWLLFFPQLHLDLGQWSPWGKVAAMRRVTDEALYQVIAQRRAERNTERQDVLSLLLEARDEEGHPLSDRELRDELITLLLAGHETTATTLEWSFDWILGEPEVHARVLAELSEVLHNEPLLPEHLPKLLYLEAVIKEVLRMRPVILNVARRVTAPLELERHTVPAGWFVAPCIHLAHRRSESFPSPDRFLPERWLSGKVDPYAWLPFGGGIRRCIGMAFSFLEMKVVLATLFSRAKFRLATQHPAQRMRRGITLSPRKVQIVCERVAAL